MTNSSSGPVTILFSDIESSTSLWDSNPEAMGEAHTRHNEILTSAFEAHEGKILKDKGDGFIVVFRNPVRALEAAAVAQQSLSEGSWPEPIGPLRVRMGINTGTVEPRGGDYYGPQINRTARLEDLAHGGQILVSDATRALASGRLNDDLALRDLGTQTLRGFNEPERVFQLVGGGLQDEFPPLREPRHGTGRLPRRLTNLPAEVTSFVGRAAELTDLRVLVIERRLVTVTGTGGVGKTRLAQQVAADMTHDLADGVWLAELASLDDPNLIADRILDAMQLDRRDETDAAEFLMQAIEDRSLLLLVDNCEHLIDAAADLIESLLRRAPGLKVLATSREPLGVHGEFLYPLEPLAVSGPEDGEWESLENSVDACGLFVERARALGPLALDGASGPMVQAICRQLEGLPLALELAAAQLDHLTLGELVELVNDEVHDLRSPYRTTPERQRTIEAAIGWSYRLLTPIQQAALRRLCVFTGDFAVEAAEAVIVHPPITGDVRSILNDLVRRSVVIHLGSSRFRLLRVLNDAIRPLLQSSGEERTVSTAHARFYIQLAKQVRADVRGSGAPDSMSQLDLDWPDIRAALRWAFQHDRYEGARAVIGLTDYFSVDRAWEGIDWIDSYLESIDDESLVLELHRARALVSMTASVHELMTESAEHVIDHATESDREALFDALFVLGMKAVETWNASAVHEITDRMKELGLETENALRKLGTLEAAVSRMDGDLERAVKWLRQVFDSTAPEWRTGVGNNLADTLMHLDRFEEATQTIDEAIANGRETGARPMLSLSLITKAEILYRTSRFSEGAELALEGLQLAHQVSSRFEFISGAEVAAASLLKLGLIDDAAALHVLGHERATEWEQEGIYAQFGSYHNSLAAALENLSAERMDRAAARGLTVPLSVLIDQILSHRFDWEHTDS